MTDLHSVPSAAVIDDGASPVRELRLNRPERLNAVNLQLYRQLIEALEMANSDASVRAIVLTGSGRAFCAGADLKAHAESSMTEEQRAEYADTAQRANLLLRRSRVPVIAAVNGAAVGAGLELALACDFMIVAREAKLRLPEVSLATFVGGGVARELPRRIGLARARELLVLGDFFSGERATAIGLAHSSVEPGEVVNVAHEWAARVAALAPVSLQLMRDLLEESDRMSLDEVLEVEARALERCMATSDWREGVIAHAEKRAPRYEGK